MRVWSGSYSNLIADNVFHHSTYALVLLMDDLGHGVNKAYRNALIQGPEASAIGFLFVAGCELVSNVVVYISGSASNAGPAFSDSLTSSSSSYPHNLYIAHNSVVGPVSQSLYFGSLNGSSTAITVLNNAFLGTDSVPPSIAVPTIYLQSKNFFCFL